MSILGAAMEGARGRQVPSSVVQADGGGLWDLVGDDALTRLRGRIERNNLLEQREEASKRREGRKRHGNLTVPWCDAFPVELEVGWLVSRCRELCAGGGDGLLHPRQPPCHAGRDAELLRGVQEHPVRLGAQGSGCCRRTGGSHGGCSSPPGAWVLRGGVIRVQSEGLP